jgi:hypothetical protein
VKYIVVFEGCFLLSDGEYCQNNYHNTSSVTSMIDTLGWPTLAERRLKKYLILLVQYVCDFERIKIHR